MGYNRIVTPEKWDKVNSENKLIMEDYLTECRAQKKKESTIFQYTNDLKILMVYILENCGNRPITELGRKDFRRLMLWMSDQLEASSARCNRLMSCCRSLLTYLENDDETDYEKNQARSIKGLEKDPVREIVFLDAETCDKLYNYFMDHEMYRDATIFALGLESSGRKGELAQVKKDSITDDGNATSEVIGKRGKRFRLLYFDWTKQAAKKYLEQRGDDDIEELFISKNNTPLSKAAIYDIVISWRPLLKELTGKDIPINVHSLRHTALQLYSTGEHEVCKSRGMGAIPINQLKNIARHSDLTTTQGYLMSDVEGELENTFGIKLD